MSHDPEGFVENHVVRINTLQIEQDLAGASTAVALVETCLDD
jgi:hypothetical protein